jgi:hypothetical protein
VLPQKRIVHAELSNFQSQPYNCFLPRMPAGYGTSSRTCLPEFVIKKQWHNPKDAT